MATEDLTFNADELSSENAPAVVFDDFIAKKQLGYQRCSQCSKAIFPPRVLCTGCGVGILSWQVSAGTGTVYSLSRIEPRGAEAYSVALIDLGEGFRMMSHVSCAEREPVIGDAVTLEFKMLGETEQPVFVVDATVHGQGR